MNATDEFLEQIEQRLAFGSRVEGWAYDRNLITGTTPDKQFLKLLEEVGELSQALQKKNDADLMDAIGDVSVVLAVLAAQFGTTLEACQEAAWKEIKGRKGKMVNGVFVKEGGEL